MQKSTNYKFKRKGKNKLIIKFNLEMIRRTQFPRNTIKKYAIINCFKIEMTYYALCYNTIKESF